ncbi:MULTISPECIES: hypothetical protein [unclassified Nitrobacter]|uniref:hypothetical protein n=1 Tax=unclassified Nitrobacter TaxID=2620411 RepID=UPI001AC93B1C|nr:MULTISPECIES: hypothetical protein [unclassified Nitrobacter]MBN9149787.1 hypothetical protein [Nitrobacter sp.]
MPLLLDCRAESIEGVLAEFRRRGIVSEDAEIILSVGAYHAADRRLVLSAAASMKHGDEVFVIPLVSFKDFQASLIDGTPMAQTEILALDGAQIFLDGSVKLSPQEGLPEGLVLKNIRLRKSGPSYRWSEFDSYVVELALEGLPHRIFREFAPGILPLAVLDFAKVSTVKIQKLKNLLNRLEDRLREIWEGNDLTAEGRVAFRKWQGRCSLRQAITRTLRESGMRPSREQGYGRRSQ